MPQTPATHPDQFPETHHLGPDTTEHCVSRQLNAALWSHGVSAAGISYAGPAFNFVRWRPRFSQVLVSFRGAGSVWAAGEWMRLEPGAAYVTPPAHFHAYHTAPDCDTWVVGWVVVPVASPIPFPLLPPQPHVVSTDPAPFEAAITGLAAETAGRADVAMLDCWARLVRGVASRIVAATPHDEVIDLVWRRVTPRLGHAWTLQEMAATLGCSEEHLRRLCQRRYGCSPMRRLTSLRMHEAARLLAETHLTVAAIGRGLGYDNEFAFSNAFKRWSRGLPPSVYRRQALGTDGQTGAAQFPPSKTGGILHLPPQTVPAGPVHDHDRAAAS